jgi:hypothetical protein
VLFPDFRGVADQEPLGLVTALPAVFAEVGFCDDERQARSLVRNNPIVGCVNLASGDYFMFHQGVTTTN